MSVTGDEFRNGNIIVARGGMPPRATMILRMNTEGRLLIAFCSFSFGRVAERTLYGFMPECAYSIPVRSLVVTGTGTGVRTGDRYRKAVLYPTGYCKVPVYKTASRGLQLHPTGTADRRPVASGVGGGDGVLAV